MIVCSCNVLSDRQIRDVVNERAPRATSQVYGCLGCSAQCGRCARTIKRIMDQALTKCPRECACCPATQAHHEHEHGHSHHEHGHSHSHDHHEHGRSHDHHGTVPGQGHAHSHAPVPIHPRDLGVPSAG